MQEPDSSISTSPGVPDSSSSGSDRSNSALEQGDATDNSGVQAAQDPISAGEAGS